MCRRLVHITIIFFDLVCYFLRRFFLSAKKAKSRQSEHREMHRSAHPHAPEQRRRLIRTRFSFFLFVTMQFLYALLFVLSTYCLRLGAYKVRECIAIATLHPCFSQCVFACCV